MLLLWMGIVAPVAEEMIFRWLVYLRLRDYLRVGAAVVISAAAFGIYHGNLPQAIYAGLVSAVFAYLLEKSGNLWSCVLLHIGANTWSLILSEYGLFLLVRDYGPQMLLCLYTGLSVIMVIGVIYFADKGNKRKSRAV